MMKIQITCLYEEKRYCVKLEQYLFDKVKDIVGSDYEAKKLLQEALKEAVESETPKTETVRKFAFEITARIRDRAGRVRPAFFR